jgi:chromosome segregation protein
MRLSRIDIKGFKSFATETTIHFNENVIGIVGPNGSGKSNIVDAIRWVLGEQKSKELRLDQMSSVIFNGSPKRKPGGLAQVSLTFENTKNLIPTEFNLVTITRILYRTGESEYQLNGVSCRLKDITNLFLDTGIGSNSYAIIALGMVDDILNDKDQSRRKMFEQAAGVSKYKHRKKETLAKLAKAKEDLDRVDDLLFEISGNLKTLEKQAVRTKKYFELKEEYKQISINVVKSKIHSLKEEQKTIKLNITKQQDSFLKIESEETTLEASIQQIRKSILDNEKLLSDQQKALNDLTSKIRDKENEKQILTQKMAFAQQIIQNANVDLSNFQEKIYALNNQIDTTSAQIDNEKIVGAAINDELVSLESDLNAFKIKHLEAKSDIDSWIQKQQIVEKKIIDAEKLKAIHHTNLLNINQELEKIADEFSAFQSHKANLESELRYFDAAIKEKEQKLELIKQESFSRTATIESKSKELEETNQLSASLNRQLDAKRNELQLTKSMMDSLEGFPESIKFLNTHANWKKGTPLLSDLIFVEEAYRATIENFLEPYLNYYVVTNQQEAISAIKMLNQAQKGKANFFLLDEFKDYTPDIILLPGYRAAIDMVQTDHPYANLIRFLLDGVVLSEEDQPPLHIHDARMVVLSANGLWQKKKHSLSGGSIGLFEGKRIGRKKNIEKLQEAIDADVKESDKLLSKIMQLKNDLEILKTSEKESNVDDSTKDLYDVIQKKSVLISQIENLNNNFSEKQKRGVVLDTNKSNLIQLVSETDAGLKNYYQEIEHFKQEIGKSDSLFRTFTGELSQKSAFFNEKNIASIQHQNKLESWTKELQFKKNQLEEVIQSSSKLQSQLTESQNNILSFEETSGVLANDLQALYLQKADYEKNLSESEQNYFQTRSIIHQKEDDLRQINKRKAENQSQVNQLKEKLSLNQFEVNSIAQRIKIEFQTDINDIINDPFEVIEYQEELEQNAQKIKHRLDNYGEINPLAVEAYDEMKIRFDHITQQKADILNAQTDLSNTIKEIETTATERFLDSFEKARNYFKEVFRSLFTEDDNCDLVLLNPNDPLESGIEIIAKPKGKRPQTIHQLSGGEKTLTSIALLFALYLLKPAPFCIFDEVDAPLDDANIMKFNQIIKKFSGDSQFIIVTHNKLTMSAVDTIYGVYLAEKGVSGVSQVDFRNYN